MIKLLFCAIEITEKAFYIVNSVVDIIFSVLLATFYTVLLGARETKLFVFLSACLFLVYSVITLIFYIIDDTYATLWHKRYFQVRMISAIVFMALFISATINLLFEGKDFWVLLTSFSFLFANLLLTFIVVWSSQMIRIIKKQRKEIMNETRHLHIENREAVQATKVLADRPSRLDNRGLKMTEHSFHPKDEK